MSEYKTLQEIYNTLGITRRAIQGYEEIGRFYRGRSAHDKEGIGVGLFLAREIVENNGGYIKVTSQVGTGSRFDVCFPNISTL